MSRAYAALLARRERLVARAAEQRDEIAREIDVWKRAADRGRVWLDVAKRNAPKVAVGLGIGAAALLLRSRRRPSTAPSPPLISRVFRGALALWRFTRWLR